MAPMLTQIQGLASQAAGLVCLLLKMKQKYSDNTHVNRHDEDYDKQDGRVSIISIRIITVIKIIICTHNSITITCPIITDTITIPNIRIRLHIRIRSTIPTVITITTTMTTTITITIMNTITNTIRMHIALL